MRGTKKILNPLRKEIIMETKNTVFKYDVAVKYMPKENITLHLIAHRDDVNYKDVLKNYNECLKEFKQKKVRYAQPSMYFGRNIHSFICTSFGNIYNIKPEHYDKYVKIKLNKVKSANVLPSGCPDDRVYTQGNQFFQINKIY